MLLLFFQGRPVMTTATAIVVAAITAAFVGFALTLWWAERQTRGIKGVIAPQSKTAGAPGSELAGSVRVESRAA
jgi:hypothetical protein